MMLPRHSCTDCDGAGYTSDYDWDREACMPVKCEACAGSCYVGTCSSCWECAPASELDDHGGACLACAAERRSSAENDERYQLAVTR